MDIPTIDDLYELALRDPIVHRALYAYRQGHITLEQALMVAVVALAKDLESARESYKELLSQNATYNRFFR